MPKSKTRKPSLYIVLAVCMLSVCGAMASGIFLTMMQLNYKKSDETYSSMQESMAVIEEISPAATQEREETAEGMEGSSYMGAPELPDRALSEETEKTEETAENVEELSNVEYSISVDFETLKEINPATAAWIYLPGSPINYPVMQSADNSDFLRHTPDGIYARSGSIFIDARCVHNFGGYNTIIYGHNTGKTEGSSAMFTTLSCFSGQNYYTNHPVIYLVTESAGYNLEIIAVIRTTKDSDCYNLFSSVSELRKYLEEVAEGSCVQTPYTQGNKDINSVDKIVTLSTCRGNSQTERWAVVCNLMKVEN